MDLDGSPVSHSFSDSSGSTTQNQALNRRLDAPVASVKFVGPRVASALSGLGIESVGDLVNHYPHRYIDLGTKKRISDMRIGERATVVGSVRAIESRKARNRMWIVSVGIYDGTGYLYGVWFNQKYMENRFKKESRVAFSGRINYRYGRLQMENPLFDVIEDDASTGVHTGRIIPVHPATQSLSPMMLRRIIKNALDYVGLVADPLPADLLARQGYIDKMHALGEIHFPTTMEMQGKARARLLFEELFLMQVGLAVRKLRIERETKGVAHRIDGELYRRFIVSLPFELTADQNAVISEIREDMAMPKPMNRLVQGEVGSGKTVVAVAALVIAVQGGYQGTMMAPTEVLAEQHYRKVKEMLEPLGIEVRLLTGSQSLKEKEKTEEDIGEGRVDIVVGTHAIIQEAVSFNRLGLAVIDEQHRFGVRQRIDLKEKGYHPDALIMSATPIPRTLSLTLYGDLDVSIIRELPGGKRIGEHVETVVCDKTHRDWAYGKIREEIREGRQAFIVCPLIEESDKLEVKSVMEEAERLSHAVFPDLRVGLIHGRLKASEKEEVMRAFRDRELDVLIATTVIEVGIDIPNATVILVEDADRFGLSQLHQLRGRIGRGEHKSYCILFADPTTEEGGERMKAIETIKDGFTLAEADLAIRGEGELFGTRQSGLPDLKLAKLVRDIEVLALARREAFQIVKSDPHLERPEHDLLLKEIKRKFADNLDWLFQA
ncbi:MAG: ATP-dependent DNA helicase RecG [Actinobacteria bacterium]|nr:ATP-dependent DNA helicase RecG [Actinomycetota bacterium]